MNKYLFLFLFLSYLGIFAQGEANNWYFGINAGITFNTSPPSALSNGQLNTNEGCSSISDANGNLLMYTDGRTIWNRNHEIMSNADYFMGTGLNGDPSSTSSGLIVPHPTQNNLYFVFTIDEPHHENANAYPNQGPADENGIPMPFYSDSNNRGIPEVDDGFNNGLNYSIVDMNLNGGLGDVVTGERNNELITYDVTDSEEIKYKASEKITAVRGRDCNSIWLITHFRNRFYAFFIDQNGINENPVISEVPPLIEITNYRRAALGYLKASPNADRLLVAHNTTNYNQENINEDAGDGNVYAYDFDNLTGEVSTPLELINNVNAYGVEFSQDGTKAYATVNDGSSKIYQWNFNSTDIPNSRVKIADINTTTALQLGPDGKIYHSMINTPSLGVISNPNATGNAVNYSQNPFGGAINLNGRNASFGLPPFIQSLFSERIPIVDAPEGEVIEQLQLCNDDTYTLSYEDIPTATYTWFKNDVLLPNETSNTLTIEADPAQVEFPYQNNYRLEVDLNTGECPLIGVAQVEYIQSPSYDNFELEVCVESNEQAVYDLTQIQSNLTEQVNIDSSELDIELYPNEADADSGLNRIAATPNFINSLELNLIVVDIFTSGVCEDRIEVELIANEYPDIDTTDKTSIYCLENSTSPITLKPLIEGEDSSLYDFLWSTGETSPTLAVNTAGEYSVEIRFTDENCPVTKTFIIQESLPEYTSENINLCDQLEYTLEMNTYPDANLTWYKNGNEILGETSTSLNIVLSENMEFPVLDTYTLEVDLEDGSCIKTWDYFLEFYRSPNYNSVELQACDSSLSGYGVFNLNNSNDQLVEGLGIDPNNISISFFMSEAEALSNENPIQNPQNFENRNNLNRLYAMVSDYQSCETLVEIRLSTFYYPNINPDSESFIYCIEGSPQTIKLNALVDRNNPNNYTFLWSTSATTSAIEINTAGTYTVEIINPDTNCSLTKTFEVIESSLAEFNLEVEDFGQDKAIEVIIGPSSLGEYEFAIDELINFQESNRFENLEPGIYTVYARDIQGCGISEKTVGVLGIMDFFTPNADGINDYWEIRGILNNSKENIQLQVYDRYGKLLSSFTNTSQGWDGTYNGKPMPVDDYWYRVIFTDGRVQTGNFTLKR